MNYLFKKISSAKAGALGLFLILSLDITRADEAALPAASPAIQPTASATDATTSPGTPHQVSDSYVLRANDHVRIAVFQEDDMLTDTRISKSGYINFPLLGSVELSGKTVGDAVAEIRTKLDKDYIINPQVTLAIIDFAPQWVTVLGEVQKPGQVEIPPEGGLDLLGAIAMAGGYTRVADPSHIIVRRDDAGHDVVLKVDAKKLARDVQVQQFIVRPGDRISVAESLW